MEIEDVLDQTIEPFSPQMVTVANADELGRDANPVTRFAHAAFEYVVHAQCFTDLACVHLFVAEGEHVSPRYDFQFLDLREVGDDVFSHARAEVIAVGFGIHVFEVKDSDRFLGHSLSGDFCA